MSNDRQNLKKLHVILCTQAMFVCFLSPSVFAIMAGGEFDLPADSPSGRVDPLLGDSPFNAVGSLEISDGVYNYIGSATVLSPNWVLTAGHNADLNDDGLEDDGLSISLHLPGFSSYLADSVTINPDFDGFGNPTVFHDLSLLYFDDPLPSGLNYPVLGAALMEGDNAVLAGFGRSGYGSYGYTTSTGLTDRRSGMNVVEWFEYESGGSGMLFRYDFDDADTAGQPDGSLGNTVETLIAPGDSGGPLLRRWQDGYALVGVNTFTEGYGGRFGDTGGGVAMNPYWDWISTVTGLAMIPEPATVLFLFVGGVCLFFRGRRKI